MKNSLQYLLKLFLFLLLLFIVHRIAFILFQYEELKKVPFKVVPSFIAHSFVMDVSAVCYILMLPYILSCLVLFAGKADRLINKIVFLYISFVVVFTSFINLCDTALYEVWGTRINQRALSYLEYPGEAAANAWNSHYIVIMLVFVLLCIAFIILNKKYLQITAEAVKTSAWRRIGFVILIPGLLVVGIRGGFQRYPLDKASAFFSSYSLMNQSALNCGWNFMYSLKKTNTNELETNPYLFFDADVAKGIVRDIHATDSFATIEILKTKRPNILLVILESFSAEVVEPLGDRKRITPGITELLKEGLLFTNFYSPGFRTEQGLAALLSGFPAQPATTIIREPGKFDHLPSLANKLGNEGYNTSFYYGGDLHFAYTDNYLKSMGIDKITGDEDIHFKRRTGWGGYDEELFSFFNKDMKDAKGPFFSIVMTTTNHEPFDADVERIVESNGTDWCGDYMNTVHYTDKCLKQFIDSVKRQNWYSNTLVVVVADHAHTCPERFEYNSAERHHIPFFLLGGVLKEEYRGRTFDRIASQVDFPATLLAMLNLESDRFRWSKNILNNSAPNFVYYSFDDGFGWINDHQQLVYDHRQKKVIFSKNDSLSVSENEKYGNQGKAYLQVLMDEYLNLGKK